LWGLKTGGALSVILVLHMSDFNRSKAILMKKTEDLESIWRLQFEVRHFDIRQKNVPQKQSSKLVSRDFEKKSFSRFFSSSWIIAMKMSRSKLGRANLVPILPNMISPILHIFVRFYSSWIIAMKMSSSKLCRSSHPSLPDYPRRPYLT
jgi:hypothetical protein